MSNQRPTQVQNGKAFEFAVATAAAEFLGAEIIDGTEKQLSEQCFGLIGDKKRERFQKAARLAVQHVLSLEQRHLSNSTNAQIRFNNDRSGQRGDVRDVIVDINGFELGISCKTNHDAFKHSRLSGENDFVKNWELSSEGCSSQYWEAVRPLFSELALIRKTSNGEAQFKEIGDVPKRFYWPVLDAFETELLRLTGQGHDSSQDVTTRLARYIIGKYDFYKIINRSARKSVEILAFNTVGSLSVPRTRLPDHVVGVDRINGSKYSKNVRLNRGYTFNFRIHNASRRVEPSLKFDITAVSLPPSEVYTNHISV